MSTRTTCRSCDGSDLHVFLRLGDLPLSDGLLRDLTTVESEPHYPLDVAFCAGCSLVQILETVDPEELFKRDYPYFSSFTDALLTHSRTNVEALIDSRRLGPDSLVVELASNDGYLLQYYAAAGIPVLGIDPAEGPVAAARERGIPSMCEFFDSRFAASLREQGKRAAVLHANNVLAHVPDTNDFVKGIGTLLADDGVAVIEVPYVKDLIDHCEFDTIYHEHLCYFSVTALDALFRRHGLSLNRVDRLAIHGGSLRLYVEPQSRVHASVTSLLAEEKAARLTDLSYYEDFSRRVAGIRDDLRALVSRLLGEGKRLAGYGAAAKGTIMLNYAGIDHTALDFVADRNVHKQGRFMPGVHIPIVPPERILEAHPDYVLILPWNFKDEILDQQAEYRRAGGKFIVPIPSPEIV